MGKKIPKQMDTALILPLSAMKILCSYGKEMLFLKDIIFSTM